MEKTEDKIQSEIVLYHNNQNLQGLLFAVPNGGFRNKAEAAKMTATGTKAGAPDLVLLLNGKFIGIEVKTPNGVQSPKQKTFESAIVANGGSYFIVRSLSDFLVLYSRFLTP